MAAAMRFLLRWRAPSFSESIHHAQSFSTSIPTIEFPPFMTKRNDTQAASYANFLGRNNGDNSPTWRRIHMRMIYGHSLSLIPCWNGLFGVKSAGRYPANKEDYTVIWHARMVARCISSRDTLGISAIWGMSVSLSLSVASVHLVVSSPDGDMRTKLWNK